MLPTQIDDLSVLYCSVMKYACTIIEQVEIVKTDSRIYGVNLTAKCKE